MCHVAFACVNRYVCFKNKNIQTVDQGVWWVFFFFWLIVRCAYREMLSVGMRNDRLRPDLVEDCVWMSGRFNAVSWRLSACLMHSTEVNVKRSKGLLWEGNSPECLFYYYFPHSWVGVNTVDAKKVPKLLNVSFYFYFPAVAVHYNTSMWLISFVMTDYSLNQ